MNKQQQELKELILDTLLKAIGCMVLVDKKEYAKQISDIYVDVSDIDLTK